MNLSRLHSFAERLLASGPAVAALALLGYASQDECTVLLYHSVTRPSDYPGLDADSFRAQMELLREEFTIIGGDEYLHHLAGAPGLPPRSILVTFDDGFANNLEVVQPIMEQLGVPWVLFTTTGALRGGPPWLWSTRLKACCLLARTDSFELLGRQWTLGSSYGERLSTYKQINRLISLQRASLALPPIAAWIESRWPDVPDDYIASHCRLLTASQLNELAKSPLVEIGCHTRSHPFLSQVSDSALAEEVDGAMRDLADVVGRRPRMFAYPSGAYGSREIRQVVASGVRCAFAVAPVLNGRSPFEVPRYGVYQRSTAIVRAKGLGLGRYLRRFGVEVG
jgi:peptidoglycan/xylan/chitin deacetylase (PgdA/CDA1 family)